MSRLGLGSRLITSMQKRGSGLALSPGSTQYFNVALHAEKWESLIRKVTCAALGMGQVNERGQGTKPLIQIKIISAISGWSQGTVANRYYFNYVKSIRTDASLANQAND